MKRKHISFLVLGFILAAMVLHFAGIELATGIMLAAAAPAIIRSSKELKEERATLWGEYDEWLKAIEKEKRDFTPEEIQKRDEYLNKLETLSNEIVAAEKHERMVQHMAGVQGKKQITDKDRRDLSKYSLLRAMRMHMAGKLDGIEAEMHQEGVNELRNLDIEPVGLVVPRLLMHGERGYIPKAERRAITATGGSAGSEGGVMIPTEVTPLITTLLDKMVLAGLGTTFWTDLNGNINLPTAGAITAAWDAETDSLTDGAPSFTKSSITPHRLGAVVPISKQQLLQTSPTLERDVINMMLETIGIYVQRAAINGAGGDDPTGLLGTSGIGAVVGGDNGAAPTWAHIVQLEQEVSVDNADIGTLAYLTNPKVRGKLKTTETANGNGIFVWPMNGNMLNGYTAGVSTSVPSNLTKGTSSEVCSAIIFGNFQDLIIAQWGGMDITIDPYTSAKAGKVEIVANTFWDIVLRRAVSFAAMQDALTA